MLEMPCEKCSPCPNDMRSKSVLSRASDEGSRLTHCCFLVEVTISSATSSTTGYGHLPQAPVRLLCSMIPASARGWPYLKVVIVISVTFVIDAARPPQSSSTAMIMQNPLVKEYAGSVHGYSRLSRRVGSPMRNCRLRWSKK